ncbi:uncharacterized protein TNCV_1148421 [Trichonephila clavipes]|nr:uncharacterized protein TNCV_1148421 [Trichonephila clavipes]
MDMFDVSLHYYSSELKQLPCDGSIRVPSTNPLGKSLGYHSRLFTTNPSEEETVIFKLNLLYIGRDFLLARGEGEKESQESGIVRPSKRSQRVSMRQIVRDMRIRDRSVRQTTKPELGLKPYKLREAQLLTEENKLVRHRICRKLLRRAASQRWERFLFTGEKFLTVQQVHNSQNNRIWCMDTPSISATVQHRQYPKSFMVWGGICASGKISLVFVEEGVKAIKKYSRGTLL